MGEGNWGWGTEGVSGVGVSSSDNWGLSVAEGGSDSVSSINNGGLSVGNSSGLGEGLGLVEWLVDVGGGSNWSDDGLLGKDGFVSEDGLGGEVGVLDWGWLNVGNWSGLMDVGGLGNGVGDGGQLWGDLGEGLGGDDSVGEVASQSVALDGSTVVLGSAHYVGGSSDGWAGGDEAGVGDSHKAKENDEALEKVEINFYFFCSDLRFNHFLASNYKSIHKKECKNNGI